MYQVFFEILAEIGRPPAGLCQLGPAGSKFRPSGEGRAFGPLQLKICSSPILNCFLWLGDQNSTLESRNIDIMPNAEETHLGASINLVMGKTKFAFHSIKV